MNSVRNFVYRCNRRQSIINSLQRAGFKSKYSLDKLYPQSSLDIAKKPDLPENKDDKFSGVIPIDELTFTYSTSSGPGGQNVNKVNTKVDLRFHVTSATWIPESVKANFVNTYAPLINKDGFLVLKSDRTRYQRLNVADCMDKLRFMVREAQTRNMPAEPKPEDLTLQLARHEKATRMRLREKSIRSEIKRSRRDEEY